MVGVPVRFHRLIDMPCMVTGVHRRFGVHVFEGRCTVEDMQRMESAGDAWFARHPGKLVEMVVIYPSDSGMTSEERAKMQQIIKRWEKQRTASATVILAEGIVGAMQRSILTGMLMIVPPPHPAKVFGATHLAVDYLAPFVRDLSGSDVDAASLREGVAALCDEFIARRRAAGLTISVP